MDHTLIKPKSGSRMPKDINDWEVINGVPFAIAKYIVDGYKPVIVSNQGGIKLGYSTEKEMHDKFKAIIAEICRIGNIEPSSFIYLFCTTNDKTDNYRKPNPGMAEKVQSLYDVDLENSIMVGDMETDEQFATNTHIGKYIDAQDFAEQ